MSKPGNDNDYLRARAILEGGDRDDMRTLASGTECRPEVLYYLAGVDDPQVRINVAANPATPFQVDEILSLDKIPDVRGNLARKLARRLEELDPEAAERMIASTCAILRRLAEDQSVEVRRIVAEEVRLSTSIPRDIAVKLAGDIDEGVCCPVLEYSPLLDDDDLVAIVAASLGSPALCAIARRSDLGERVSESIAGTLDEQAVIALLSNASAQIREAAIDMIIEAAPERPAWHGPLVHREDLSGSAIRRVAGFVADELIEAIAMRNDITTKMAEELRMVVTSRIGNHAAEIPGDQVILDAVEAELSERLVTGRLNAGFVAEASEQGRHAEVWVALGLLSGAGRNFAHRIFASRNAKAIIALSWLADLPAWLTVTLQTKIGQIPEKECIRPRTMSDYPLSEKDMLWQLDLFGYREPAAMATG